MNKYVKMNLVDYLFENTYGLDKKLILGRNEEVSYKDVYTRIKDTANILRLKRCQKGEKILLLAKNSVFFISSYFGIIKSGCTCVPLDIKITELRLQQIVRDTKAKRIFISKSLAEKFRNIIHLMDEVLYDEVEDNHYKDVNLLENIEIDEKNDVAVIMFTSGSEGKQKGVMLTHQNIIANTKSIIQYLNLDEGDIIETVLPFYYCYGTSLLHSHIRVGGSLVLNNKFQFPGTVIEDIKKYECTGFAGVPSTFHILLKVTNLSEHNFPSLRYVTQAGGKLSDYLIKKMVKSITPAKFIVMYGQTEATARLSYLPPEYNLTKLGSIGKGIPGVALKVINKEGKPVGPNEIGEIVASGDNVMKGYLNDPEQTFKVIRNRRLHTGDLATVDKEGFIYIVSREKRLLKIGGNRVSPKEIENVIDTIPEVVNCAVIGVDDEILGEAAKAFVVVAKNRVDLINKEYVLNWCKNNLEQYKVPKEIEFIDALPTNSYGKVLLEELISYKGKKKDNKIISVLGTRPEIIKLSPILPLLDQNFNHKLIHTGQHYSYNMDRLFFNDLKLREPDYNLNIGSGGHGYQTGTMMVELEKIFFKEQPDLIVVQGDTNTTLATALTAAKLHIPLTHIESGSRSFNIKMPEEINRIITDQLSQILFINDDDCLQNVKNEGVNPNLCYIVGNTSLDAIRRNQQFATDKIIENLGLDKSRYVLVTFHRAENTEEKNLVSIIAALNKISEKIKVIFPIHPRTKKAISKFGIVLSSKISLIEPIGYLDFISLMKNSLFIMTDSGGIQRESAELNVPCLILRNETEATDILKAGKTILATTESEKIIKIAEELIDNPEIIQEIKDRKYHSKKDISQKILKEITDYLNKDTKEFK